MQLVTGSLLAELFSATTLKSSLPAGDLVTAAGSSQPPDSLPGDDLFDSLLITATDTPTSGVKPTVEAEEATSIGSPVFDMPGTNLQENGSASEQQIQEKHPLANPSEGLKKSSAVVAGPVIRSGHGDLQQADWKPAVSRDKAQLPSDFPGESVFVPNVALTEVEELDDSGDGERSESTGTGPIKRNHPEKSLPAVSPGGDQVLSPDHKASQPSVESRAATVHPDSGLQQKFSRSIPSTSPPALRHPEAVSVRSVDSMPISAEPRTSTSMSRLEGAASSGPQQTARWEEPVSVSSQTLEQGSLPDATFPIEVTEHDADIPVKSRSDSPVVPQGETDPDGVQSVLVDLEKVIADSQTRIESLQYTKSPSADRAGQNWNRPVQPQSAVKISEDPAVPIFVEKTSVEWGQPHRLQNYLRASSPSAQAENNAEFTESVPATDWSEHAPRPLNWNMKLSPVVSRLTRQELMHEISTLEESVRPALSEAKHSIATSHPAEAEGPPGEQLLSRPLPASTVQSESRQIASVELDQAFQTLRDHSPHSSAATKSTSNEVATNPEQSIRLPEHRKTDSVAPSDPLLERVKDFDNRSPMKPPVVLQAVSTLPGRQDLGGRLSVAAIPPTGAEPVDVETSAPNTQRMRHDVASASVKTGSVFVSPASGGPDSLEIAPVVEQITRAVYAESMRSHTETPHRFQMSIRDPDLGTLTIEIQKNPANSVVDVRVTAERAETHQLLEAHADELAQSLQDQGLNFSQFDLSQRGQEGGADSERIRQFQEQIEISRLIREAQGKSGSEAPKDDSVPTSSSYSFRA